MKYIIVSLLFISCSKSLYRDFEQNLYKYETPYKSQYLDFINDSMCIYFQKFHCDISEKYKETSITCRYRLEDNFIILENIDFDKDKPWVPCTKLPIEEVQKCGFLTQAIQEHSERTKNCLGCSPFIEKEFWYSYIDNISVDTLFYRNGIIYYNKWSGCGDFITPMTYHFINQDIQKYRFKKNVSLVVNRE